MTADADEPRRLAELYSGMIDAELGQIARDPGSLTDAAQNALAAEVRRRELAVDQPELVEGYDEAEYRNLVTIRKFRDLPEAPLAKGKLDSAGIESCLVEDNMVQVRPVDANPAAEILEEPIPENFDVGCGESWQPRCPACYSPDVSFKELVRTVPNTNEYVDLPLQLRSEVWKCRACGGECRVDPGVRLCSPVPHTIHQGARACPHSLSGELTQESKADRNGKRVIVLQDESNVYVKHSEPPAKIVLKPEGGCSVRQAQSGRDVTSSL